MRKFVPIAVALCALTMGASAQEEVLTRSQESSELRSDWIVGANVVSPEGESVGSIDGILLDQEAGQVTAAIVSVGGFLGFGGKQIAVDWNELDIRYDGAEVILPITREQAEEAPEFAFRDAEAPPPPAMPEPAAGGGMDGGLGGAPAPAPEPSVQ